MGGAVDAVDAVGALGAGGGTGRAAVVVATRDMWGGIPVWCGLEGGEGERREARGSRGGRVVVWAGMCQGEARP